MRFGLSEKTIEQINHVFSKYPQVEIVIIYGSRAKGNYKNGSDIDFTLKGDELNLSIVGQINLEFDDSFLPYTFDISIYNQINNPDLIEHINRRGLVFYEKK